MESDLAALAAIASDGLNKDDVVLHRAQKLTERYQEDYDTLTAIRSIIEKDRPHLLAQI